MSRKTASTALITALTVVLALAGCAVVLAAQLPAGVEIPAKLPKAHGPAVVTTLGQSPGALMIKMLCGLVKLPCEEKALYTADELQAALKKKDTAPKALFITMGTSLKGMGAAGIDIDAEVKRVQGLIAVARKAGLLVIGTQLEGPSRRVDETDERSVKAVAPQSDVLLIRKDVNFDGYFTKTSKEKGIPLIQVGQAMDATHALKALFGLQ